LKIVNVKVYTPESKVIVKVETDEGISGLGDASFYFYGKRGESMSAAIKELSQYLIGKDPLLIEHHYQVMCRQYAWARGPFVMCAISGVEHALWDILGKSLNAPVYQLLGGRLRDRIRVYSHAGTPEDALALVKHGITAIKVDVLPTRGGGGVYIWKRLSPEMMRKAVDTFAKVREAVGSGVTLMAHLHQELTPATAVVLAHRLEPYDPFWFEEPLEPGNVEALAWVAAHIRMPIATGEALFTRHDFRKVLETHAADIIQPDPVFAGGIWECRKIAAMAEPYYVSYANHYAGQSPVALAVNVQLDTCIPNLAMQELPWGLYVRDQELVKEPLLVEDGYIKVPTKPGLGVELNDEAIAKRPPEARSMERSAAYDDGTIFGRNDLWSSEEYMLHPERYR
jgi:galactonate dehydratase